MAHLQPKLDLNNLLKINEKNEIDRVVMFSKENTPLEATNVIAFPESTESNYREISEEVISAILRIKLSLDDKERFNELIEKHNYEDEGDFIKSSINLSSTIHDMANERILYLVSISRKDDKKFKHELSKIIHGDLEIIIKEFIRKQKKT